MSQKCWYFFPSEVIPTGTEHCFLEDLPPYIHLLSGSLFMYLPNKLGTTFVGILDNGAKYIYIVLYLFVAFYLNSQKSTSMNAFILLRP